MSARARKQSPASSSRYFRGVTSLAKARLDVIVRQGGVTPQRHPDHQLAATSSSLTSSITSPSLKLTHYRRSANSLGASVTELRAERPNYALALGRATDPLPDRQARTDAISLEHFSEHRHAREP
jgi:hypothetical protein